MAIDKIGSKSQTTLDNSPNQRSSELPNSKAAHDHGYSSIASISTAQEDGIVDFVWGIGSGVWSIVTWPFNTVGSALSSCWSWMTGSASTDTVKKKKKSDDDDDDKSSKKSKGGGGGGGSGKGRIERTDASVDFLEFFDDVRTHKEFKSDEFRKTFKALSPEEKKSFELALLKEGKFQTTTDSRGWAKEQINEKGKGDYSSKIQGFMQDAAELFKAQTIVRELGVRYENLAEKQRKGLDREDIDDDFTKEEERHDGVLRSKVPTRVQDDVKQCVAMFAPDSRSAALSRKDKTNWDKQEPIFATRVKAYILQAFGKHSMLFVSDTDARNELATMARVIGKNIKPRERDFGLSEADFANGYNRLGKTAKRIYADLIGLSIARPEEGESYILGHLKVDGKDGTTVPPDVNRLGKSFAFLLAHDGITMPDEFMVYFPREEREVGDRDVLLGSGRGRGASTGVARDDRVGGGGGGSRGPTAFSFTDDQIPGQFQDQIPASGGSRGGSAYVLHTPPGSFPAAPFSGVPASGTSTGFSLATPWPTGTSLPASGPNFSFQSQTSGPGFGGAPAFRGFSAPSDQPTGGFPPPASVFGPTPGSSVVTPLAQPPVPTTRPLGSEPVASGTGVGSGVPAANPTASISTNLPEDSGSDSDDDDVDDTAGDMVDMLAAIGTKPTDPTANPPQH